MLIILSGFLFPILISCIFYIKLIFYKKKKFHNKVEVFYIIGIPQKNIFCEEELPEAKNSNPTSHQQLQGTLSAGLSHPKVQVSESGQNPTHSIHEENKMPTIFSAEEEKMLELIETKKSMAQILAAERSIKTNFVVGFLFCLFLIIQIVIVPKPVREHVGLIVCSTMKAVLPIFTTIANFGTVRFVTSLYWNAFQKFIPFLK